MRPSHLSKVHSLGHLRALHHFQSRTFVSTTLLKTTTPFSSSSPVPGLLLTPRRVQQPSPTTTTTTTITPVQQRAYSKPGKQPKFHAFPRDRPAEYKVNLLNKVFSSKWVLKTHPRTSKLSISQTFRFATFQKAWEYMQLVAAKAREFRHHPEWSNVYNVVHMRWTTHDSEEGLTHKDFELAWECEMALRRLPNSLDTKGDKGVGQERETEKLAKLAEQSSDVLNKKLNEGEGEEAEEDEMMKNVRDLTAEGEEGQEGLLSDEEIMELAAFKDEPGVVAAASSSEQQQQQQPTKEEEVLKEDEIEKIKDDLGALFELEDRLEKDPRKENDVKEKVAQEEEEEWLEEEEEQEKEAEITKPRQLRMHSDELMDELARRAPINPKTKSPGKKLTGAGVLGFLMRKRELELVRRPASVVGAATPTYVPAPRESLQDWGISVGKLLDNLMRYKETDVQDAEKQAFKTAEQERSKEEVEKIWDEWVSDVEAEKPGEESFRSYAELLKEEHEEEQQDLKSAWYNMLESVREEALRRTDAKFSRWSKQERMKAKKKQEIKAHVTEEERMKMVEEWDTALSSYVAQLMRTEPDMAVSQQERLIRALVKLIMATGELQFYMKQWHDRTQFLKLTVELIARYAMLRGFEIKLGN